MKDEANGCPALLKEEDVHPRYQTGFPRIDRLRAKVHARTVLG